MNCNQYSRKKGRKEGREGGEKRKGRKAKRKKKGLILMENLHSNAHAPFIFCPPSLLVFVWFKYK
jgi:hypothetical protein